MILRDADMTPEEKKKMRGEGLQLTCIMCRAELALVSPADSRQDGCSGLSLDMDVPNLKHSQHLVAKIHHPTNILVIKSCPKRRRT